MSRLTSIVGILLVVSLTGSVFAALPQHELDICGLRPEIEPPAAGRQELERKLAERTPPWKQRWQRMIDGRQDALGRTPAEALQQAREYDRTMPSAPADTRSSANQTVPGDAWRSLGPDAITTNYMPVSGRVRGLVVIDENLIYVGAAGGGVWKWRYDPIEQIETWTPLSDYEDSLAIGALAVDPQDPQILYAGTGEVSNTGSSYHGAGLLRSIDGGQNWDLYGQTQFAGHRFSTIAVDPSSVGDPKTQRVLWAATTAGLFRSTNGGVTWALYWGGNYSDVVLDPLNSDLVFAARHGVGIYKIDMGGTGTPTIMTDPGGQLPTQRFGRIRLAAVEDPLGGFPFLFASYQDTYYGNNLKGIWRATTNGGAWTRVTGHPRQFADGLWATPNRLEVESNDTIGTADIIPVNMSVQGTISSGSDVDIFSFTLTGRDSFNAEIMAERAGSGLHPRLSLLDASGNPVIRGTDPYVKNGDLKNTAGVKTHDSRLGTGWALMPAGTYHLKVESDDGTTGQYQLSILGIDLWCQCDYDQALTVDPDDPDVIYMGLISFFRSTNGGTDWTEIQDHANTNWVHQDIQIVTRHPSDPNTIFVGSDGGVWRSSDRGDNWTSMNTEGLVITQPIKASIHPTDPGFILIGNQDNASSKLEAGAWTQVGGGDGGTNAIAAANDYYYSAQNGAISKIDPVRGYDPIMTDNGFANAGSAFHSPLTMDPNNDQVLLAGGGERVGTQTFFRVYRTTNGGLTWNTEGAALATHVMALAFAPSNSSIYYVGTNRLNPRIWQVTGTGANWTPIEWANTPQRTITDLKVGATNPNHVYVTFDGFGGGNVFRTTDGGTNWEDIGRAPHGNGTLPPGISQTPLPDVPVEAIVVDPTYPNTIWVGTDLGVYRTLDGGVNWHKFGYLLPNAGIRDLVLSLTSGGGRLIAATHGRGVWELFVGNDECADAEPITDGTLAGTTRAATADGLSTCSGDNGAPSVWYEYTATCDGELHVETCGSNFDTLVSVHSLGCPGDPGNEETCNDDCTTSCGGSASCAVTQVNQGSTYNIRITGYDGASGDFLLDVRCEAPNEVCETGTPIAVGQTLAGSTRGAAWDAAPDCAGESQTAPGVWYTVQGTGNWMTLSTCGTTDYDSKLSVYCSGCVTQQCAAADDDTCGTDAEVTFCSTPGVSYDVLVHGYLQEEGSFQLQATGGAYCGPFYLSCAPSNDDCNYPQSIDTSGLSADNTDATSSSSPSCRATYGDLWYDYAPICHGFATMGTCGSSGTLTDTVVAVYDGCGGEELACSDDSCGLFSDVVLPMEPGKNLRMQVGDFYGDAVADEGTFTVDVDTSLTLVTTPWPGLYASDGSGGSEDYLLWLDRDTNSYSAVGALGKAGVTGLAWTPGLGLLYGVNDQIDTDELVVIDPDTGVATSVGPTGYSQLRGLAWDPNRRTLYSVDTWTDDLVRVDPYTGAATPVGPTGFPRIEGLAFDSVVGKLYGADADTDLLIEIDTATGLGTAVVSLGVFGEIDGLAFDSVRNELIGSQVDGGDGRLVRIDPSTGVVTLVVDTLIGAGPEGLTYIEELPDATVGQPYDANLPVSGGCPIYIFGSIAGEPPGLTLDVNGKLSGTPTQSGVYTLSYVVDDFNLSSPQKAETFRIVVRPANDRCEDAALVGSGSHAFSTIYAGTDGPDEPGLCNYFGDTQVASDIWYHWQATCTGSLEVETCGSGYDTKVAVYDGPACPTGSSAAACNDDATCGSASEISHPVQAGQYYTIRVGGYLGAQGPGTLGLTCVGVPAGGCCTGASCSLQTAADCAAMSGSYLGDGTDCTLDSDGDGVADGCDTCPADPFKFEPGDCGCGVPEFDFDGDGLADCIDPDVDGDGVNDDEDIDPLDRFRCIDTDGDGCDDCSSGRLDPLNDGPDADFDGWCDVNDCNDLDPGSQRIPGEAFDLMADPAGLLTWARPLDPGGPVVWFDLLRAAGPLAFMGADCIESDDLDVVSVTGSDPAPGGVFYYLVRAGNSCGDGTLGFDHPAGVERVGRTCP